MSTSRVSFDVSGSVARFTVNRPDARNAMTMDMYGALVDACDSVDADPAVRVFVIRAAGGGAFIAGTDIAEFSTFTSGEQGLAYERRMETVIDRLERVRAVTIAQVEGVAAGGGCLLALACDLRVCTPAASFGIPVARTLGNCLSPANFARLAAAVGPVRAKELLITARLISADEARMLGLVTRLVDPAAARDGGGDGAVNDLVNDAVIELADALAAHAPRTIWATKQLVKRSQASMTTAPQSDDLVAACYGSADFREGVAAFLDRRRPRFTGQ